MEHLMDLDENGSAHVLTRGLNRCSSLIVIMVAATVNNYLHQGGYVFISVS